MTKVLGVLTSGVVGVLDRDMKVAVAEISRSGCLLVTSSPIAPGTVASLFVQIDGAIYSEDVRVARCLTLQGAGERHHVGVEFLTLRRPGPRSLRLYAAALAEERLALDSPAAWG